MNFLAIPTLKKDRSCFFFPISMRPLRSLKDTFDNARIGMENVGSLERSAAAITMSARPTSFLSTAVAFFCLVVMESYFLLRGAIVLAEGVVFLCVFLPEAGLSLNNAIWSALPFEPMGIFAFSVRDLEPFPLPACSGVVSPSKSASTAVVVVV